MGTTEKKNRGQRDDKDGVNSVDASTVSSSAEASLAARRARLRGSLARPSNYTTDNAPPDPSVAPPGVDPYGVSNPPPANLDPNNQPPLPPGQEADPGTQVNVFGVPIEAETAATSFETAEFQAVDQVTSESWAQMPQTSEETIPESWAQMPQASEEAIPESWAQMPQATEETIPEPWTEIPQEMAMEPWMQGLEASQPYQPAAPEPWAATPQSYEQAVAENMGFVEHETASVPELPPEELKSSAPTTKSKANKAKTVEAKAQTQTIKSSSNQLPGDSDKALDVITSIDQSLNACATNLAALQNLSVEQTEVLKGLNQSFQNQALLEIGLNLNSLTESLAAALEPMKAIGELIPSLDQLITILEGGEADKGDKLSPDQLVASLSDQLSAGLIDPWTFKCAYMAVYPADHPADLLHRLVELLGSQRLSGDLFRAAYEAVQAAEPPTKSSFAGHDLSNMAPDDAVKAQLLALERAHREIQARQDEREREFNEILANKEKELDERLDELKNRYQSSAEILQGKDDEFRAVLESKDMELIEKESELNMLRMQMEELRSQTEDMIKEMQKEMQEQLAKLREEQAKREQAPASAPQGFFDTAPNPQKTGLFDAAPTGKPLFTNQDKQQASAESFAEPSEISGAAMQTGQIAQAGFQAPVSPTFQPPQPQMVQNVAGSQVMLPGPQPAPAQASPQQQPQPQQAPPKPPGPQPTPTVAQSTPFTSQSGSYGSGVRAQVFEVIVRQALAGAPWREICAGPMQVNNISPDEVEAEVKRRQSMLGK